MSDDYLFDTVLKDPAETLPVVLDFYLLCARVWAPNERYGVNEYVRPQIPTGFAYKCTSAGTSSGKPPRWPTVLGQSVTDGSCTWLADAAGSNGIDAITTAAAVSDPTGITIADLTISEDAKLTLEYSGGTVDTDYDVVYTLTINGFSRVARQTVSVTKR